jgi:hypothetical protein
VSRCSIFSKYNERNTSQYAYINIHTSQCSGPTADKFKQSCPSDLQSIIQIQQSSNEKEVYSHTRSENQQVQEDIDHPTSSYGGNSCQMSEKEKRSGECRHVFDSQCNQIPPSYRTPREKILSSNARMYLL